MRTWTTSRNKINVVKILGIRSNVFLITNGHNHILVDCSSKGHRHQLLWNLAKTGIRHLDALILTHSHFDHAGNAHYIRNRFNTRIIIHKNEAPFLQAGSSPLPDGTFFFTKMLVRIAGVLAGRLITYQECQADLTIEGKYSLQEYGLNAYILPTPGHSSGSVSVIIDDEIALTGDSLYGVVPGKVMPPFASDKGLLIRSWKDLLDTGSELFVPSHGKSHNRKSLTGCYTREVERS